MRIALFIADHAFHETFEGAKGSGVFDVVTGTRDARVVGLAGAPSSVLLLKGSMAEDGERSNEGEPERESTAQSEPEESSKDADAAVEAGAEAAADAGDEAAEAAAVAGDEAAEAAAEADAEAAAVADDEAAATAGAAEAAAEADDEAGAELDDPPDRSTPADAKPGPGPATTRRRASKLWWALPILMVVEFYVYGHNGELEICVGKEGDTDFSLVGQPRTDENRWKFPRCETRLNLGLRSQKEARIEEGTKVACRGATIFRHQGEAKACVAGEQGWVHRVEGHFVAPWEPAYYQHLFWFLQ